MSKRTLLLFGATGKVGAALRRALRDDFEIVPKSSRDLDAADFGAVTQLTRATAPDVIVNAAAFLGVEPCDREPERAFQVNARFPKLLAQLAASMDAVIAHISSDSVFDGRKGEPYVETDAPAPLNLYGGTKFLGDAMVMAHAPRHYVFRLPLVFGPTSKGGQFVEKMMARALAGEGLRIAGDVVGSPSYSLDLAAEMRRLIVEGAPFGLYHIANAGQASLYELLEHMTRAADLDAPLERVSHREFPSDVVKHVYSPIRSAKLPPLRPWREAADEYVAETWR